MAQAGSPATILKYSLDFRVGWSINTEVDTSLFKPQKENTMQIQSVYASPRFSQPGRLPEPLYGSAIRTPTRGARRLPSVEQPENRLTRYQADPAMGEQPGRLWNLSSQAFPRKLPIVEALIFCWFLTVTLVSMIDGHAELSRLIRTDSVGRVVGKLVNPAEVASNNTEVAP